MITLDMYERIREEIHDRDQRTVNAMGDLQRYKSLDLIDYGSYRKILDHLTEQKAHFVAMHDALETYYRINLYVPVSGPMARKGPKKEETLSEDEIALIREAYEMTYPDFPV